jgi:hypothetical protein
MAVTRVAALAAAGEAVHGARGPNHIRLQLQKDNTTMFQYQISQVIHQERQREIERQIRFRADAAERSRGRSDSSSRSIRRSIGHRVIDVGRMIAAERPARTRRGEPCGSIGELAARR